MGALLTRSRPAGSAVLATARELGQATGGGRMPFVSGRFSVADEWAEVSSSTEGRFMERIARGAFAKTIREDRARIRILFEHATDPFIGRRPIAPLEGIGEDERGGWYFGRLFDTIAARELAPLLEAGVLGSSFRFGVEKLRSEDRPARSDFNPEGLPQRTILEARLVEVGPTAFPVYANTPTGTSTGDHSAPRAIGWFSTDADWQAWLDRMSAPRDAVTVDEFVKSLRGWI